MEKISGILAPSSRPVWQSSEIPRPKRISEPQADDQERMEAIRPLRMDVSLASLEDMSDGERAVISRGSMLNVKA